MALDPFFFSMKIIILGFGGQNNMDRDDFKQMNKNPGMKVLLLSSSP